MGGIDISPEAVEAAVAETRKHEPAMADVCAGCGKDYGAHFGRSCQPWKDGGAHGPVFQSRLDTLAVALRAALTRTEQERDAEIADATEWSLGYAKQQGTIATQAARLRQVAECPVCRWPHPPDNEHYICPCCGFHVGYNDALLYQWNGQWWAVGVLAPPQIVAQQQATIAEQAREIARLRDEVKAHEDFDPRMVVKVPKKTVRVRVTRESGDPEGSPRG